MASKKGYTPFRLKYLTVLRSVNVILRPPTVWSSANVRNFQRGGLPIAHRDHLSSDSAIADLAHPEC